MDDIVCSHFVSIIHRDVVESDGISRQPDWWMDVWVGGCVDKRVCAWVRGWIYRLVCVWMYGWVARWMDVLVGG